MDIPDWASAVIAAAAGLVLGPWLAVVIARVPRGQSLLHPAVPGSRWGARPRAADMIPVAGWLRRRHGQDSAEHRHGQDSAEHRHGQEGGERSGFWYLAAELITAVVFAALALRLGFSPVLPAYCYMAAVGVALAIIDIQHRRLPDALTLTSYPVTLVLLGLAALGTRGGGHHLADALLGMIAAGLLYLLQALIYPAGMGWGDVKLAGLIGLYLGWLGTTVLLAGLLAGYLLAALTGIALLVTRRATRKSQIPFGPFMLAGALIAILASGALTWHY
jgi:leader peptidase (prepilin peptidase)/N-methyltransferase